ncbi:MAG: beta-lactamase family protein [Akkermansiaceae bacterium]|nr:beta-lactamase family protein [Akkermansiaceae bacterium]
MKCLLILLMIAAPLWARESSAPRELPVAAPEDFGLSPAKLARIGPAVTSLIEERKLAGASVMVLRRGHVVYRRNFGHRNRALEQPVEDDTIFRIYSMTKAITSAAVMMLVEEGQIGLDDPAAKFIPPLAGVKVWTKDGEVDPDRPPTVRDLLRHTSGYSYGWGPHPVDKATQKADPLDRGHSLEELGQRAGAIPLRFQPGTAWHYGISTDLLGRVVEVASGRPFDRFLQDRLFDPLDMRDTGFHVPARKKARFSVVYGGSGGKPLVPVEPVSTSRFLKKPKNLSGGGGLVSTIRDYARFLQMIANGGEFQGRRYLRSGSVALMTTDQLPGGIGHISLGPEARLGVGFGLGFCVRTADSTWDPAARIGEFGWGGMASTHYWVSPRDQLVVITMEQTLPFNWNLERAVKPLVYDALVK